MLDKKLVRVNYYGSYYDVIALERWLTEQAKRGLKFAYFEEHTPVAWFWDEGPELHIRYLVAADTGNASAEQLRVLEGSCAANGWEEVHHKERHFVVYAAEDPAAFRPVWHLTEKEWHRRWYELLVNAALVFVMVGIILWGASVMLLPERMSYYVRITRGPWEILRNISIPLTLAFGEITVFYDLFAWWKNRRDREAAPPSESVWAVGMLRRKISWAAIAVAVVSILIATRYDSMERYPLGSSEIKIQVPQVSLATVEGGAGTEEDVRVGYRKSFLLPLEVTVTDWKDWTLGDGEFYYRGMTFTCYRLRSEASALRLAEDLCHWDARPLPDPCGFDAAWWVETVVREVPDDDLSGNMMTMRQQYLTAVTGDTVIAVDYEGSSDLSAALPEFYTVLLEYRSDL